VHQFAEILICRVAGTGTAGRGAGGTPVRRGERSNFTKSLVGHSTGSDEQFETVSYAACSMSLHHMKAHQQLSVRYLMPEMLKLIDYGVS
jgi:hypothetical protein